MASDDAVNQHTVDYETSTDRSLLDFMKKDDQDESKVVTTEFDDKLHISNPNPNPEPEPKFEECKVEEQEEVTKPSLLQKLHRSGSSSSSSSEEEVEEEGVIIKKKKEKKGLKEKIGGKFHKEEDTSVPVEVVAEPEEKKGLLEKIKDKVPAGHDKKVEEETGFPAPAAPVGCDTAVEGGEPAKKGIFEKIKEKLPGHKAGEETVAPTPAPGHLDHSPNVEGGEPEPAKKGIMDKIKEKMPGYHPKTTTEEEKKESEIAWTKLLHYYYAFILFVMAFISFHVVLLLVFGFRTCLS